MRYDLKIESMEWSYSRLSAYENCPYKWLVRYIYGIKGQSKFFAQFGSFMHSILQKYLNHELNHNELTIYYLTNFRKEVSGSAPNKKIYSGYLNQGRQYLKTLSLPDREVLGVELKLKWEFAGYPFQAYIDCLSRDEDGKVYITDHKSRTLKPRSGKRKPTKADKELDKYLRQLYIYAHAVHSIYGFYPDYLEFNCFRSGVWIQEPFRIEKMLEIEAWASSLIEKIISTDNWYANPDYWFCNHICDVSEDCEYKDLL